MNDDDTQIIPPLVEFQISNVPHGGWIVSERGVVIHAASTSADLCYWLEGVTAPMDIRPESEAANPLPSFLNKAKALVTWRAK